MISVDSAADVKITFEALITDGRFKYIKKINIHETTGFLN